MGLLIGVGNTKPTFPYDYYYGIEWDYNVASPACTRIGRPELHVSLPIQSKMRRCVLRDDGTVAYYLHANDSTKRDTGVAANLDGTDGQVMVEIPEHYRKFEVDGTKSRCLLSEYALPGFHLVPLAYRSAYEAALDRTEPTTPKLASVVNTTAAFRGGSGNNSNLDETNRSLLGRPTSYIEPDKFRLYARNRGNAGKNGAGWNCDVYEVQKTCWWLYAVEYANFNCQLDYNAQPTSEGYKQGGLGKGVSMLGGYKWNTYNGFMPFVPCGHTNSLGNKTGVVDYNMLNSDGSTYYTVSVPSYRGLENPFGHIWSFTDGCKCSMQRVEAGPLIELFVCTDPAKFQSDNYDGYEKRGNLSIGTGYIKAILVGQYGENMPLENLGASSTTYFCDYFDRGNPPSTGEKQENITFGGSASNELGCGFCCVDVGRFNSTDDYKIGTRLCFLPA